MSNPAPLLPWQRMAETVLQLVKEDPWVRSMDPRPRFSVHERAIRLEHGASKGAVQYRIEDPNWWEPLKMGRARVLASRLVIGLREKLEG